ncbi:hypothetical protein PR003_g14074 [Phytophthora rubi]|uniref:Uncharacterized protein n=1 Tax=Phytophthora rubi TaxID=129364 RepID=A0A6A3K266_9STRA|nr:hypothetical protein PR001_g18995 [Phytophthora rubi]KAE9333343.1 hypothetical protein PR003_g14074 [Phytophthora rubi]
MPPTTERRQQSLQLRGVRCLFRVELLSAAAQSEDGLGALARVRGLHGDRIVVGAAVALELPLAVEDVDLADHETYEHQHLQATMAKATPSRRSSGMLSVKLVAPRS